MEQICAVPSHQIGEEGAVSFADFTKKTRNRWRWLAARLERSFRLPNWMCREDLEQEMLLVAWKFWQGYEADRGNMTKARFVEWKATKRTKKLIQKARGVEQHRRKGKPRISEVPIIDPGEDDMNASPYHPAVEATQHLDFERAQKFAILADVCETHNERAVLSALESDRSYEGAAAFLYMNEGRRFRLSDEKDAAEMIRDVVNDMVRKFGNSEEARAS